MTKKMHIVFVSDMGAQWSSNPHELKERYYAENQAEWQALKVEFAHCVLTAIRFYKKLS